MLSAYQALSTSNNFKYDYAQVNAVAKLDDLSEQIYQHDRKSWLAKRLKNRLLFVVFIFMGESVVVKPCLWISSFKI
jgi:hypothetical protein